MRFVWVLLLTVLLSTGCTSEKQELFDVVIENGQVLNLETGTTEYQTLCISGGRIVKMLNATDKHSYVAKETIDAKDKFVLPGFWDNHVHFRGGDSLIPANKNFLKLFIANGITTVRDAGGDLTTSVMKWKEQIGENKLVGPTIFTSGPKIDGPNGTWAGSLEVENETDIIQALDSLEAIPADFVKLYDSRISGDAYLKTIAEAENRNLITSGHMPFTVELGETIGAGIDAIEHLYYVMKGCSSEETAITRQLVKKEIGFWEAMPALQSTYEDSTAQSTFDELRENGVFVVPTLHIGKVLSYLDEVDHTNDPYLKYMTRDLQKTYEGRINRALNASEKARQDRKDLDTFFGELAKSLHEADVRLLAGSDSGAYNSYTYPGISLHRELEEMVANGIPPLDALRTSAYNGADFLKKNMDYGTLSEGKISDIVILEANPLEKISNTKRIFCTVHGKKIFYKSDLDALLKSAEVNQNLDL